MRSATGMMTDAVSPDSSQSDPRSGAFSGEHLIYFYQKTDSLLETLCDFVGSALRGGRGAIVVATKPHLQGLEERLEASGVDLTRARKSDRYAALDAAETLAKITVAGSPDGTRFSRIIGGIIRKSTASAKGEPPVVFGEMVSLLWADGKTEAAIRLEQLWNDLAKKQSFTLRCAYPIADFQEKNSAEPLMRICSEHSTVILDPQGHHSSPINNSVALKQSEERFRWLVNAVQDYAIFMLDTDGVISSWNPGAQSFEISPEFGRVRQDVELALFRVLQEGLTNVHRHSDSATAKVQLLGQENRVILKIIDEGKGIHPKNWDATAPDGMRAFGVGLRGMTERLRQLGGTLELSSKPGGTTVTAAIPVAAEEQTQ